MRSSKSNHRMLHHNVGIDQSIIKSHKNRKRSCSSSLVTSSSLMKIRFKRVVLVGKKGGTAMPAPAWKMSSGSPSACKNASEATRHQHQPSPTQGTGGSVSARKLINALWQLSKVPCADSISVSRSFSDQSQSNVTRIKHRSRANRMKKDPPAYYEEFCNNGQICRTSSVSGSRSKYSEILSNASAMEIRSCYRKLSTPSSSVTEKSSLLKDLNNNVIASRELLKVLAHASGPRASHSATASIMSALCVELDRAHARVQQLIHKEQSRASEIMSFKRELLEENDEWKNKKTKKINAALRFIVKELETERRSRKRAEKLNKKLAKSVAEMESSLLEAAKEIERERRSRETIEYVCNELVRGIGEDKAEVEELRRTTAKAREELEKEREMLQLADEWREERVQMKLLEARFQFEEKNAAVDRLRDELEVFLAMKRDQETATEAEGGYRQQEDGNDGIGSEDSDLQSIELNMDRDMSNGYRWSHATTAREDQIKLVINDEECESDAQRFSNINQDAAGYKAVKNLRDEVACVSERASDRDG